MSSRRNDERITQFCSITGASVQVATRCLANFNYQLDAAMDAYFNDPSAYASTPAPRPRVDGPQQVSRLNALFDKYKEPGGEDITIDGTIKFCEELDVNPEDVVMLAVAYELKSPGVGEWNRKGWVDGWKALGCDSIETMKATLPRLRQKLATNADYFQRVYNYTFEFAKSQGQRSVSVETAVAFWGLLLPHGLKGGALSHILSEDDQDGDVSMSSLGWEEKHIQWWFEFLGEKGGKGISKDTWAMLIDFIRTIDSNFDNHDLDAAWPSLIDDFAEWAKKKADGKS